MKDRADPSQPGGPSTEGPADLAFTRALLLAALGCSWRVLLAPGSSLGAQGSPGWLLTEIL